MLKQIKKFVKRYCIIKKVIPVETPVFHGQLLQGKTALILGGSGGIGSEIAHAFSQNGGKVILTGTNQQKLENVCKTIGEEKAQYFLADLRNVKEIEALIVKAADTCSKIDIFVHCAGIHCHEAFGGVSEQVWDDVIDINLKSTYFFCQYASDYMIKNGIKGHILTIGSASSAKPGWTPYEISKSGVKALTLGFADKLIQHGIVVNSLAPGPVSTPMLLNPEQTGLSWPGNPTGRMSTAAEIANWAVLMASDMGNMVVGDTFYVSGGSGTVCINK